MQLTAPICGCLAFDTIRVFHDHLENHILPEEVYILNVSLSKGPWQIGKLAKMAMVTHGGDGSSIYTTEGRYDIPPVKDKAVVDPTGCGDAYRAGLLYGLMHAIDWETTGRIAGLMDACKIESGRNPEPLNYRTRVRDPLQAHL